MRRTSRSRRSRSNSNKRAVRVLVADDHVDSADTIATSLETAGHTTRIAYSAEQAEELALGFEPDVVLLDVLSDGQSGYDLAVTLRSHESLRRCRLAAPTSHVGEAPRASKRERRLPSSTVT